MRAKPAALPLPVQDNAGGRALNAQAIAKATVALWGPEIRRRLQQRQREKLAKGATP